MDTDELWAAIDDQRRRTANLLETLTEDQWDHPSLCAGWSVRHVAAHLTLQQQRACDVAAFVVRHPSLLGAVTLNRTIRESAIIQARLSTDEIIARIRAMIGSRRHNAFVTERETLIDILVHGQDIAVPLGLDLAVLPEAAAEAATRVWATRGTWLSGVFRKRPLDGYRLTATDAHWSVGEGLEVAGAIRDLLLLITCRDAGLARLAGAGAEQLRGELATA